MVLNTDPLFAASMRIACLCLLLICSSCSNIQQQEIVAVDMGGRTGRMVSPSSRSEVTPTPKAALRLLDQASEAAAGANWVQAFRYLDQAQRMAPEEAQVYLRYGEVYLQQQNAARAKTMFQRALSLAGNNSSVGEQALAYLHSLE